MSGLEALGAAAAIIQVADIGFKLSRNIYVYSESVASVDKRLNQFAKHVDLTSNIVRNVGELFSREETKGLVAEGGIKTTKDCVAECEESFREIETFMEKARKSKWRFPFRERKLELLDARLEKLKTTLTLVLAVLTHQSELKAAVMRQNNRPPQDKKLLNEVNDLKVAERTAALRYNDLSARYHMLLSSVAASEPLIVNAFVAQDSTGSIDASKVVAKEGISSRHGRKSEESLVHSDVLLSTTAVTGPVPTLENHNSETEENTKSSPMEKKTSHPVHRVIGEEDIFEMAFTGKTVDDCVASLRSLLSSVESTQKKLRGEREELLPTEDFNSIKEASIRFISEIRCIFQQSQRVFTADDVDDDWISVNSSVDFAGSEYGRRDSDFSPVDRSRDKQRSPQKMGTSGSRRFKSTSTRSRDRRRSEDEYEYSYVDASEMTASNHRAVAPPPRVSFAPLATSSRQSRTTIKQFERYERGHYSSSLRHRPRATKAHPAPILPIQKTFKKGFEYRPYSHRRTKRRGLDEDEDVIDALEGIRYELRRNRDRYPKRQHPIFPQQKNTVTMPRQGPDGWIDSEEDEWAERGWHRQAAAPTHSVDLRAPDRDYSGILQRTRRTGARPAPNVTVYQTTKNEHDQHSSPRSRSRHRDRLHKWNRELELERLRDERAQILIDLEREEREEKEQRRRYKLHWERGKVDKEEPRERFLSEFKYKKEAKTRAEKGKQLPEIITYGKKMDGDEAKRQDLIKILKAEGEEIREKAKMEKEMWRLKLEEERHIEKEKENYEDETKEEMRTKIRNVGFQDNLVQAIVGSDKTEEVRPSAFPSNTLVLGSHIPTYSRINRIDIDLKTLDYYGLPWKYDVNDLEYIIICQALELHELYILFEHTRKLREGRLELLIEDPGRKRQQQYAFGRQRKNASPNSRRSSSSKRESVELGFFIPPSLHEKLENQTYKLSEYEKETERGKSNEEGSKDGEVEKLLRDWTNVYDEQD